MCGTNPIANFSDMSTKGEISIKMRNGNYEIYYSVPGGKTKMYKIENAYTEGSDAINSFGFMSSHFKHGCEMIGKFELDEVNVGVRFLPID